MSLLPMQVYSGMFGRTMVFTSTKHEANELALNSAIKQDCQVLHGDIPQKQREITLKVWLGRRCGEGSRFGWGGGVVRDQGLAGEEVW